VSPGCEAGYDGTNGDDRDAGEGMTSTPADADWPPLPLDAWRATKDTLHRYCQMLGKVRLALAPFRNHWWHVTLHIDPRGLTPTTGPIPVGDGRVAEIRLNLRDHGVELEDSAGAQRSFALPHPLACATFHDQLCDALAALDVPVRIDPRPYDLGGPPFPDDYDHAAYDAAAATRYWRVLCASAGVLGVFSRFNELGGIAEYWVYADNLSFLQQIGAIPEDVIG
jgi:hypothetical protein